LPILPQALIRLGNFGVTSTNLKVRDADHDSFFQKPFCVFCGDVTILKTRNGLLKSGMNKHWLLSHAAEFAGHEDGRGQEEMVSLYCPAALKILLRKAQKITVMLSPSQLDLLTRDRQLDFDLEEGDLIARRGKSIYFSRNIVIARTVKQDFMLSMQDPSTGRDQIQSGTRIGMNERDEGSSDPQAVEVLDSATTGSKHEVDDSSGDFQ